ncbi:hypothetical protein DCL20_13025 [Acinetobacter schindleri]|nr:hypothetical protein DCL20_13025 [Acinetobacter schindleri]
MAVRLRESALIFIRLISYNANYVHWREQCLNPTLEKLFYFLLMFLYFEEMCFLILMFFNIELMSFKTFVINIRATGDNNE